MIDAKQITNTFKEIIMSSLFSKPEVPKPPAAPPPPKTVDVGNTGQARSAFRGATGGDTIATGPAPSERQSQFTEGVEAAKKRKKTTEILG